MGYQKVKSDPRRAIGLALLMLAAGPAQSADGDAAIRLLAAQDAATLTVGERLSIAAHDLCRPAGWAAGLLIGTRTQYGRDYRDAATRVLRLGAYPTVTHVTPDGAGARAGLAPGDQITAIEARPLPPIAEPTGPARMTETDRALDALDAGLADGTARIAVLRAGRPLTLTLAGTPACRARFEVRPGASGNASATRDRVQVSSDLVDPAQDGIQLPALIAHELAHVVLRHDDALKQHWRGLLPGFGKGGAALRASEIAADRLSIYLMARAGYRAADAVAFWEAFGRRNDRGVLSDRTHPHWRDRVAALRQEIARLAAAQAAGRPVEPPADLLVTPSP